MIVQNKIINFIIFSIFILNVKNSFGWGKVSGEKAISKSSNYEININPTLDKSIELKNNKDSSITFFNSREIILKKHKIGKVYNDLDESVNTDQGYLWYKSSLFFFDPQETSFIIILKSGEIIAVDLLKSNYTSSTVDINNNKKVEYSIRKATKEALEEMGEKVENIVIEKITRSNKKIENKIEHFVKIKFINDSIDLEKKNILNIKSRIKISVFPDGSVQWVDLINSSGFRELDELTIENAFLYKVEPLNFISDNSKIRTYVIDVKYLDQEEQPLTHEKVHNILNKDK